MSSVSANANALSALASQGLNSPTGIAALPDAAGLQNEANNLNAITATPIDYSQQNQLIAAGNAAGQNLSLLSQNLGVQRAVAAQLQDKSSRQGNATSDARANQAAANIATVGATGAQEQQQLEGAALSNRSQMALAKLKITSQQLQQQALQNQAQEANVAAGQQMSLAETGGAQQVQQAATSAKNNETALMQQYEQQQWNFWTKIATGLISAAGGVAGFLVGGPAGAAVGASTANALTGANSNTATTAPTLAGYQTYTPQTGSTATTGTASLDSTSATAGYTSLPDSLPVV